MARIVARSKFDYRMALAVAALLAALIFAYASSWHVSIAILIIVILALGLVASSTGSWIVVTDDEIVYRGYFGASSTRWRMDGRQKLYYRDVTYADRFGRTRRGALVLESIDRDKHARGIALPRGRYTQEGQLRKSLLEAVTSGKLRADARAIDELNGITT